MFNTWKYDAETDQVQSVRNGFDPVTARSSSHQACDRCHEKKLKCSGDKNGCERCRNNRLSCEYTRSGSKSRRSKQSSSPRKSSADESSPRHSPKSKDQTKKHSSKSSHHHHGHHHGHHSSRATTTSVEEHGGVLGQFDFSMLGPEDGFDLNLLSDHGGGYAQQGDGQWDASAQYQHAAYNVTTQQGYQGWTEYHDDGHGHHSQGGYGQDPAYWRGG